MGAVNELQPGTCGSFASLANLFLPADGKVMGTEHGCPAGILKSHQANGSVFVFAENKTQPTQPHLAALGIHFRAVYQLKYVEHFTPPGPRIQGQTLSCRVLSLLCSSLPIQTLNQKVETCGAVDMDHTYVQISATRFSLDYHCIILRLVLTLDSLALPKTLIWLPTKEVMP